MRKQGYSLQTKLQPAPVLQLAATRLSTFHVSFERPMHTPLTIMSSFTHVGQRGRILGLARHGCSGLPMEALALPSTTCNARAAAGLHGCHSQLKKEGV